MLICRGQSTALWWFSGGRTTMSDNTWPALSTESKRAHRWWCHFSPDHILKVSWDTTNKHRTSLWRSLFNRDTTQQHDLIITTSSLRSRPCHLLVHESLCQWQLWLKSSTKPTQSELQTQRAFREKFCWTEPKNWGDNSVETLRVTRETWKYWIFNEFQVRVTTTELKNRFTQVLRTHHHPARAGLCWVPCKISPQIINTDIIARAPYCILCATTLASGKCGGVYFCSLFTNIKWSISSDRNTSLHMVFLSQHMLSFNFC